MKDESESPSYIFGHRYRFSDGRFCDNNEPVKGHSRKCPKCGLPPTPEGHDPCIADLPGVAFACCGHGVADGYIYFSDGRYVGGSFDRIGMIGVPGDPDQIGKSVRWDEDGLHIDIEIDEASRQQAKQSTP